MPIAMDPTVKPWDDNLKNDPRMTNKTRSPLEAAGMTVAMNVPPESAEDDLVWTAEYEGKTTPTTTSSS